ncbi:MAG: hypothetical protein ACM3JG_15305 [Thiohalocapsa sp.]
MSATARAGASGRNQRAPDASWAAIEHPLRRLRDHRAVDAGEALGRDLRSQRVSQLEIGFGSELQGRPLLGAPPHPVGNKAEAVYRRGDLFQKRRKLMEAWALTARARRPEKLFRFAKGLRPEFSRSIVHDIQPDRRSID